MSTSKQVSLQELLADLESAVRDNDRLRAEQLRQSIQQALAKMTEEMASTERHMRELLAELDLPRAPADSVIRKKLARARTLDQPDAQAVVYPVWFGTNRQVSTNGKSFTSQRSSKTSRGRVLVNIPQAHRFGETGSSFWKRLLRWELSDDRLSIQSMNQMQGHDFFKEIHEAMEAARESGNRPHGLFFLHGFNVTFEEAATSAAQIGYDLKVPGATAFFSWPSRGSVTAYPADEATIEASERAITDFLVEFAANCGAEKVHVIAHSMGNRGLLRALQRIAANAETCGKVKFGQIFLAAPDVDRDLFLDLAHLYPEYSERTTLYASDADVAVHLSAKLHDAARAGYFKPYTIAPRVDTIGVPDFDVDLLGHSYFARAEALLHDIYDLMQNGQPPAKRQRIAAAGNSGESHWTLKR